MGGLLGLAMAQFQAGDTDQALDAMTAYYAAAAAAWPRKVRGYRGTRAVRRGLLFLRFLEDKVGSRTHAQAQGQAHVHAQAQVQGSSGDDGNVGNVDTRTENVAGGREDEEVEEDSGGWSTTGLRVEDLRSANEDDEAAGASEGRGGGERRWAPHDIRRIADERRCDIDRRSNLTVGEFLEQYVKRNKPVMITGGSLFRDWPAVGGADGGGSGGGARKGGNTGGTWRREAFIRKYGKSTLATVRSSDSIAPYRGIGGETAANGEGAVGAVGAAGAAGGGTTKFMTVEEYINTPEQG